MVRQVVLARAPLLAVDGGTHCCISSYIRRNSTIMHTHLQSWLVVIGPYQYLGHIILLQ